MGKLKQQRNRIKQEQKLAIFVQDYDHYEEKKVKEEYWIKQFNGKTGKWQVAVYSPRSFKNYKVYQEARKLDKEI